MALPNEWLDEFQVNTGTANVSGISDPQIIGLQGGNYLVAWVEAGTTGVGTTAGNDIIGKIFDAEGGLVRDSFRINTFGNADDEDDFDIAATNDGGFSMVYIDDDISNPDAEQILYQRFDDNGDSEPGTSKVLVTSNAAADVVSNPKIVVNLNDNSAYVTFTDKVGTASDEVRAIRIDSDGVILTPEFDAAQNTSLNFSRDAEAAINSNGELVTVYEEQDGSTVSIELYITDTAGVLQHNVGVSSGTGSDPQVTTLLNGNIAVSWSEDNTVYYRVYNENAGTVLAETKVFAGTDNLNESSIKALPDGGFVIVWDNDSVNTLQARRYNEDGSNEITDNVFQIEATAGAEVNPNVGVTADGRVLFSWEQSDDVFTNIWDTRGTNVDAGDYDFLPSNFIETGETVTGNVIGTTITGDGSSEELLGQGGNDSIDGGSGFDNIQGGAGNDTIEGGFGTDTIDAGSGNDLIIVKDGEFIDEVDGGSGNDTLDLSDVGLGEAVNLDLRNSTWTGLGGTFDLNGIETVFATQDDDTLRGKSGATLNGGGGDDIFDFRGGDGLPDFDGGSGNDTADFSTFGPFTDFYIDLAAGGYIFSSTTPGTFSGDILNTENYLGSAGIDNVLGSNAANSISTGDGNDTIDGAGGNDTIDGGAGDDLIDGGTGADVINGGSGNDTIDASNGADVEVFGDAGNDRMLGGGGNDKMSGGADNDTLLGGNNNDTLLGDDGNDSLFGELGQDQLEGGAGNDYLAGGNAKDTLLGGEGDDSLLGQGSGDYMEGNGGNDTMRGGATDDTMSGGSGMDSMDGGAFNDLMFGGSNNDNMTGGSGLDTMDGGSGNDNMDGGTNADSMFGGSGNDSMLGGLGEDLVLGGLGSDTLEGGNSNDTLDGGGGGDTVFGGSGGDLIIVNSGEGGDVLFGEAGTDTFDFESGFVSAKIEDFNGSQDTIDLADVGTVSAFGDLVINYSGGGTSATVDLGGGDEIIFNNLTSLLDAGDFSF